MPKIKSKRQLLADRKRVENLAFAEREDARLKANAQRLRTMSSGFVYGVSTGRTSGSKVNTSAIPRSNVLNPKTFVRETPSYPSLVSVCSSPVTVKKFKALSAEMEERERLAQEEIARKRKRVAVVAHKSAYQYLSDDMDLTLIGRK